jgi:hypothetical protein
MHPARHVGSREAGGRCPQRGLLPDGN